MLGQRLRAEVSKVGRIPELVAEVPITFDAFHIEPKAASAACQRVKSKP